MILQDTFPLGVLRIEQLEIVPVQDVLAAQGASWPQPYRMCLRHNTGAKPDLDDSSAAADSAASASAKDRDFLLCSEEPLDEWLQWIRIVQGVVSGSQTGSDSPVTLPSCCRALPDTCARRSLIMIAVLV